MKWRRVAIRGYRSIVDADVRLGEITVIIGETDSGKTNFCRALRDWAFNARGDGMISAGGTVARVGVVLEDGRLVAWEHRNDAHGRGRAGSAYYVRVKGETVEHRQIGADVPVEVSDFTGVRELEVDKDEFVRVQFAEQSDPWFLLASPPWTPGKVTRVVGKIAGLDTLISANRALERERIEAGRREKASLLGLATERRALAEYVGLDRALALANEAAAKLGEAKAIRGRIDEARAIAARMRARKETSARAKVEVEELRPIVARADELGLLGLLEKLELVRWRDHDLQSRDRARELLERARNGGRKELAAARAALEKLAKEGDVVCATCGGPIHDECRVRLAEEATVDG